MEVPKIVIPGVATWDWLKNNVNPILISQYGQLYNT